MDINKKRQAGLTFIELMIAMVLMTVIIMALASTFVMSTQANEVTSLDDVAQNALGEQMAHIWAKAREYDSGNPLTIGESGFTGLDGMIAFYSQSANSSFTVGELLDSNNTPVKGQVIIYLNEQYVPQEIGADITTPTVDGESRVFGKYDLDGDGAFTNKSTHSSGTYGVEMVPVEVRITWETSNGQMSQRRFVMISRTQLQQ